jgi:hypothetical protein
VEVVGPNNGVSAAEGGSSGSGGTGTGSTGFLVFQTTVSGAQAAYLPANILVTGIVADFPISKAGIGMSIVGGQANLLFGDVDWYVSVDQPLTRKSFIPGVYLYAASQIFTVNTNDVSGAIFKCIITYTRLTGF